MLFAPKIDPSWFLNTMHLAPWKLVPLFAEYQSIRLVHLQTFLSIIFTMVSNEFPYLMKFIRRLSIVE